MGALSGQIVRWPIHGKEVSFFVADPDDAIQRCHARRQFYEAEELALIGKYFSRGCFIDIGANVGNHAIYAAKCLEASRVICIEPNPEAVRILVANIQLNDLAGIVERQFLGLGLAAGAGTTRLNRAEADNPGGTRLAPGSGEVPLVAGDDLFGEETPQFIKIDVEGLEIAVLQGLEHLIARCSPAMFVAVDNDNRREFEGWCAAHRYAVKASYRRYPVNENFLICRAHDTAEPLPVKAERPKEEIGAGREVDWSSAVMADRDWRDHEAFNAACDAAFGALRRVTPHRPFTAAAPTVICVVRNEERRLRDVIRHYKGLGAGSLHIIDNDSTDRTADICRDDDGITLWWTDASYAAADYGQLWVGALARKYGLGKWILNVDADELLVYGGMERHGLGALQGWLARRGYRRLFAPMIDMYGSRRYGSLGQPDGRTLIVQNPFFDGRTDAGGSSYRYLRTPYGPLLAGGPRNRVLSAGDPKKFYLSKFPLSLWAADTAYANAHFPYPFSDNPDIAYGALLHFKFLSDFQERVATAVEESEHWQNAAEYREYQQWIDRGGGHAALFSTAHSRIYRGPRSLVAAGLIQQIPW